MMIKKILFCIVAASTLSASAVNVANESALVDALLGTDKNITITSSFKTTKNITIPEGYVVTIPNGVTLTIGTYKQYIILTRYYKLTGGGMVKTGKKVRIKRKESRTLPITQPFPKVTIAGEEYGPVENAYSGATYEVTEIVTEVQGGTLSYSDNSQIAEIKACYDLSWDDTTEWKNALLSDELAVFAVDKTKGVNSRGEFKQIWSTFNEWYNNGGSMKDGHVAVVLKDSIELTDIPKDSKGYKSIQGYMMLDCAGKKITFSGTQFNNSARVTCLNANQATLCKLTNARAAFINCQNSNLSGVLNNSSESYSSAIHVYDCANLPSFRFESNQFLSIKGAGVCIFSGGPYSTSGFSNNYHLFGGTYTYDSDPASYIGDTSYLTAVPLPDGKWSVQEFVPEYEAKIGNTEYLKLEDAINAVNKGETVQLLSNVELETPIEISADKDFTLDLAGCKIEATNGAIINKGVMRIEEGSGKSPEGSISSAAGNVIDNSGQMRIVYGEYYGNIHLSGGELTVYNGLFKGSISVASSITDPSQVANLKGGLYTSSVTSFLRDGQNEFIHDEYYRPGNFPYVQTSEEYIDGTDKGWRIELLPKDDLELFSKASNVRIDYSEEDWCRRAELRSMLDMYTGAIVDIVIKFNRAVKQDSICAHARTILSASKNLDRDLSADEVYRVFSSMITSSDNTYGNTLITYNTFLTDSKYRNLAAGIKNLSDANAGTVCTIELQLCRAKNNVVTETLYILASESYQFPWKEAVPELREDDTSETVASALAGTADAKVAQNIKDVASYNSYRQWTTDVKGATAAEIKAAPNAWLSYALNTTNLVKTPVVGDLKVESIVPSRNGTFALELSVKDIDIGTGNVDDVTEQSNLAKVFGIEGAISLNDSAFSAENVVYTFGTPVDGKVTVEAKPAVSNSGSFFFRAKMDR